MAVAKGSGEKEGLEGKGLLAFCNMDIFSFKIFGEGGSATLSSVLDVLLQAALPFHRGMVGRSWIFPPWSFPGWAVGTGTVEFLAGGRQGNAFLYRQPWRRSWKARRKERHGWRVWQRDEGMWYGQIWRVFSGVEGDKGQEYMDTGKRTKRLILAIFLDKGRNTTSRGVGRIALPEKHSPVFSLGRSSRNFEPHAGDPAGVRLQEMDPIPLPSKPRSAALAQPVLGLLTPSRALLQK